MAASTQPLQLKEMHWFALATQAAQVVKSGSLPVRGALHLMEPLFTLLLDAALQGEVGFGVHMVLLGQCVCPPHAKPDANRTAPAPAPAPATAPCTAPCGFTTSECPV